MERSAIRGSHLAGRPPRISLRCIRATGSYARPALTSTATGVIFSSTGRDQPLERPGENAMTIAIRQLHKHFVGEVSGLDLRKPLTPDEAREIEAAMDKYAVLVFHDQDITDEQQMAFALNFGQREDARGGTVTKEKDYRLQSGLNDVSNLGKDGKPLAKDSRAHLFNLGNCLWHSDSSFRPIPAKFSLLSARVLNPKGGNTEFADMRAAYDALDDETKAEIDDLVCEHSLMYSRGSLGFTEYTDDEKEMFKPVLQRLVRTHPVHRRKSLYLSSHAGKIVSMSVPEGRLLLRDLNEHATQSEFVYVHKWRLHDLVMWDNRQTMHRVRRYDQSQPRDMRRATVAGTEPTVQQQAAE
jgi:alpha-ketoglutarate-dependent 2,4-dichlorophenoxyacetate dioxygenase